MRGRGYKYWNANPHFYCEFGFSRNNCIDLAFQLKSFRSQMVLNRLISKCVKNRKWEYLEKDTSDKQNQNPELYSPLIFCHFNRWKQNTTTFTSLLLYKRFRSKYMNFSDFLRFGPICERNYIPDEQISLSAVFLFFLNIPMPDCNC